MFFMVFCEKTWSISVNRLSRVLIFLLKKDLRTGNVNNSKERSEGVYLYISERCSFSTISSRERADIFYTTHRDFTLSTLFFLVSSYFYLRSRLIRMKRSRDRTVKHPIPHLQTKVGRRRGRTERLNYGCREHRFRFISLDRTGEPRALFQSLNAPKRMGHRYISRLFTRYPLDVLRTGTELNRRNQTFMRLFRRSVARKMYGSGDVADENTTIMSRI